MNDNDIIKALEHCVIKGDCADCMYNEARCLDLSQDALNLINRQKAEIERLNHIRAELSKENEEQDRAIINALHRMKVVRVEAIKEFAKKISKIFERYSHVHNYAEKAKRCTIETDEGTSIELVSVWDVMELKKHEMVDYETMNELQDNIQTISKERLLSELEEDFRLLVKEMTEG